MSASSMAEMSAHLHHASSQGAKVLLVLLEPALGPLESTAAEVRRLAPGTPIAVSGAEEPSAPEDVITLSSSREGAGALVSMLLERLRLERQTDETRRQLELVSTAGVAMSTSFDISAILQRMHEAAGEILGGARVDVFYAGCPGIHARAQWFPSDGGTGALRPGTRRDIEEKLARGLLDEATLGLEAGFGAVPLARHDDMVGWLFFEATEGLAEHRGWLLSVLALQAAAGLGNIHSSQERLQFERLSTIGRMIGSIVHDFRSPLTALRGYAGMLASLELDDAERQQFASALLEECDRLDHMVSEMLLFARGRRPHLERTWTRLGPYLEDLGRRARRHFADEGIRVALHLECDEPVLVDRKRFERALWNIVANACQAMAASGGNLRIRSRKLGARVAVEIEDDGPGVPEEIRHRVFEPFFSYGKSRGIGLGMATAKLVVEEHAGGIELETNPGEGTLVRFLLPLPGPEEAAAIAATRTDRADS